MQFSPGQRNLAIRALTEAEERTSGYYCIPPFRWHQLRYDLLTSVDHGSESLPESILAKLQPVKRINHLLSQSYDYYRIQLNDHGILSAAKRENLASDLYPFFLYILTHEMVHLVRLSTILNDGEDHSTTPEQEEARVHKISHQILCAARHLRIETVLSKFCYVD